MPRSYATSASNFTSDVTSVSNIDGTLTISPITGDVIASLNLSHANTWAALQTFGNNISFGGATLNVTSLTNGNIIRYNGTNWVNVAPSSLGLVNSVSNSDGTLTISPTTGAVVASLNLAHANTWTALQTFDASLLVPTGDQIQLGDASHTVEGNPGTGVKFQIPGGEQYDFWVNVFNETLSITADTLIFKDSSGRTTTLDFTTPFQMDFLFEGTRHLYLTEALMVFDSNTPTNPEFEWATEGRFYLRFNGTNAFEFTPNKITWSGNGLNIASTAGASIFAATTIDFQLGGNDEILFAANAITFNNGTTDTGFGWSTDGQLDFVVGATSEMRLMADTLTFENGATDTGFSWANSGRLSVDVGGASEVQIAANNMTFQNGTTNTAFNWATDGQLSFNVGGNNEMRLTADTLTFENGATDTALGWSSSGQLDFFVGSTAEMRLTADTLTFENGATDTALSWSSSGVLDFLSNGATEMSMRANSLTFDNGATDTGLGWATSGQLDFFVSNASGIEMSLAVDTLTFNNGTNDTSIGWATNNQLDFTAATSIFSGTLQATTMNTGNGAVELYPSGTYTPTLTNVANLAASTAYQCQYMRVGNVVTVSGKVDVDPTLATTSTQLGISLPIASNFGAAEDCAGVAFASGIAAQGAAILADTTNDRAQMQWISGDITNQPMYFTFTYEVI